MNKETQFVEEMVELFSDSPFANTKPDADVYVISYEALSCFFRNQHRILISGDLNKLLNSEPNAQASVATDDDSSTKAG